MKSLKEKIEIMQAFEDGKEIQALFASSLPWVDRPILRTAKFIEVLDDE
jgi:hypothetical protein